MNKKDRLKKTYVPEQVKFLKDGNIATLWSGKPPITSFSTPYDTISVSINHVRHDIYFYDIEHHQRETYVYSGKLGKLAAVYAIEGSKILEKITFGTMGTWSTNEIFRISDTDFIMVTDRIRSNDFETNIEIIRLRIE